MEWLSNEPFLYKNDFRFILVELPLITTSFLKVQYFQYEEIQMLKNKKPTF